METQFHPEHVENIKDFLKNIELSASKITEELQEQALSVDPYNEMIKSYLGSDFKPKTLAEINIPPEITPYKLMEQISNIGQKLNTKYKNLSANVQNINNIEYPSMFIDENGQLNTESYKKYLAFHEFFKTLTPEVIQQANPLELTNKICYEYCKSLENF
jgi:hypothetical protein